MCMNRVFGVWPAVVVACVACPACTMGEGVEDGVFASDPHGDDLAALIERGVGVTLRPSADGGAVVEADLPAGPRTRGVPLDPAIRSVLSTWRCLRVLSAAGSRFGDTDLAALAGAGLPLEELDLSDSRVTSRGLVHLASLERLRRVKLTGLDVTGAAIEAMGRAPALEELDLSMARLTDEGLEALRGLSHLRALTLVMCEDDREALYAAAGNLTTLRTLAIYTQTLTPDRVRFLSQLANVEELRLSAGRLDPEEDTEVRLAEALAGMRHLRVLSLSGGMDTSRVLASLHGAPGLRQVTISALSPVPELMRFGGLRALSITRPRVLGPPASPSRGLASLRELHVRFGSPGSLGPLLGALPRIRCLGVAAELAASDASALADLPELDELHLRGCLGDVDFPRVRALKTLRKIVITQGTVSTGTLAALAALPHLTELELRGCRIGPEGLEAIGRMRSLRRLGLSCTRRIDGDPFGEPLRDALQSLSHLAFLDVRGAGVSYVWVRRIREGLPGVAVRL